MSSQNPGGKSCDHNDEIWGDLDDDELLTPLEKWRNGYLWVTHLTSQLWCEQQLEYGFTRPQEALVEQPEYVSKGSQLHLARELESEDYVDVKIESDEDIFAIKVLNLYSHLKNLKALKFCREVPIFGRVGKLFLLGKIDELRWTKDGIEICEFKTRTKACLPGKAQQITHDFQLMIYKYLLENLHNLKVDEVCETLKLDKDKTFGEDVLRHCPSQTSCASLSQLMDLLRELGPLHVKQSAILEYRCQDKADEVFANVHVDYNETWLAEKVASLEQFWLGQRFAQGVDIEEAWKCSSCCFAENCSWRLAKAKELQRNNGPK